MKIGVVKEIKNRENRVALTPAGAAALVRAGHVLHVEHDAGQHSGFSDGEYARAGARITGAAEAWDVELVLKVKEPLESEYPLLGRQILFTYLHLAGVSRSLTDALLAHRTTAVAYETVEDTGGRLPLLAPMSAVAGNMSITIGSYYLARFNGGRGTQLGTVLGERHGKVVIIGDGVVGTHAAQVAAGLGTEVMVFGRNPEHEQALRAAIPPEIQFRLSTPEHIAAELPDADLVVGAVLLRGDRAPHVVSEAMVRSMPPGSVIVDVSIDQGGCIATSRPTSHSDPVFAQHGVIHYCVTNMPGAYPRTSTVALTHATLPYVLELAEHGLDAARRDPGLGKGINTHDGLLTCEPVARALDLMDRYRPFV